MQEEKIKRIKNAVIIVVCVVSVAISAVNYFRPHEKSSASEYIVFYETSDNAANEHVSSSNRNKQIENTEDTEGKVSINKSTKEQLMSLPGIGETKANAIIKYRESYGGFVSIDELTEVNGIGESTLAKLKDLITL